MEYMIIGLILFVLGYVVMIYNRFKSLDLQAQAAISNIDVALVKRYDTLINLVEVVKGYTKHESSVFSEVVKARSKALSDMAVADEKQTVALNNIMALAEAYPDLKANQNFLHLQKVIADTEEHLQAARRLYNQSIKAFNTSLEVFPSNIIGSAMNLTAKEFYSATSEQKEAIRVNL